MLIPTTRAIEPEPPRLVSSSSLTAVAAEGETSSVYGGDETA